MSESEKKKPAVIKKWTPDEVRQLYQGNSDQTKCVPYVKLRADDAFPCANIVHILIDDEWTDSQISKCSLCKPNTKVFLLFKIKILNVIKEFFRCNIKGRKSNILSHYDFNHRKAASYDFNPITKRRKIGFSKAEWEQYRFDATVALCENDNAISMYKSEGSANLFKAVLGNKAS